MISGKDGVGYYKRSVKEYIKQGGFVMRIKISPLLFVWLLLNLMMGQLYGEIILPDIGYPDYWEVPDINNDVSELDELEDSSYDIFFYCDFGQNNGDALLDYEQLGDEAGVYQDGNGGARDVYGVDMVSYDTSDLTDIVDKGEHKDGTGCSCSSLN